MSTGTRHAFREHLAQKSVVNVIQGLFGGAGVPFVATPPERLPTGERRALVEQYYASVDWSSLRDVARILRVFEAILLPLDKSSEPFSGLVKFPAADGFSYEDGQLVRIQKFNLQMIVNATGLIGLPRPLH